MTALAGLRPPETGAEVLVSFDAHHAIAASLPEAMAQASPERLRELMRLLVERAEPDEQQVARVVPVPPARPFFARTEEDGAIALAVRPRRGAGL